ncbi:transport inhibitor response 1-like protein, partial [Tanacetum coccineum]
NLTELDLRDCEAEDVTGHWLTLEWLVARSPNLRKLRLNRVASLDKLSAFLRRATTLVEFGKVTYSNGHSEIRPDLYSSLSKAFSRKRTCFG